MHHAVETMRTQITVTVKQMRGTRNAAPAAFEVSYDGVDPTKVKYVTTAIANLFIEDNLKLRESQAAGTSRFLERELERMKEVLRQKEESVRQFKQKHMGQLPEQMQNNLRILSQLQQHLDTINAGLQQTEDRRVLLRAQLGMLVKIQAATLESMSHGVGSSGGQIPVNLEEARQQLQRLRSRYSDKHPDVVRLAATVVKLENEQEAAPPDIDSEAADVPLAHSRTQGPMRTQREDSLAQLNLVNKQLETLVEEKKKIGRQIEVYRQRIENGPRIEQMFVDLRRGYEEATESHKSLLQKKLQAKLAENLERTQKGEQFVILEPANLPHKPFKPNIWEVLFKGLMLALSSGLGLAFLREHLDPTFWRSRDLETMAQIPVIVSIPVVATNEASRRILLKRVGAAGALVSMASVLLYALFVLWKIDPTAFPFGLG
jgi:polysaccharide chain length determinant protein (PEP-CTERM system associated)